MEEHIIVRPMEETDIAELVLIEKECFSLPWSEQSFRDSYALPYAQFFVGEIGGRIAGYAGLYKVGDEGDITNVAVSHIYRRKGVAKTIMESVIQFAKEQEMDCITLEVRESNSPAIALYEKMGFKNIGVRKNFYEKPIESAIIYQYIF